MPRLPLTAADLAPLTRAALGPARGLTAVTRLRGGTKKGVYRLHLDDGSTAVAYVWSPDEDYWDAGPPDPRDPFSHATGLDLFTAAHDRLAAVGARTPRLLYADPTRAHLPADAAVVEDLPGGTLEDLLARDPGAGAEALRELADLLATLHSGTGARFGKVALVDNGGSSYGGSCEERVLEGGLRCVEHAAEREPRVAAVRAELADLLRSLAAEIRPRSLHSLIHGELGPDHVLLTPDGHPALIDIEGLLYFDVEWEHVFLDIRFGPHYDTLRAPDLDEDRVRLYRLAMHLSLVAGPLRLLDGDIPDRAFFQGIVEHNLGQALTLLRASS